MGDYLNGLGCGIIFIFSVSVEDSALCERHHSLGKGPGVIRMEKSC